MESGQAALRGGWRRVSAWGKAILAVHIHAWTNKNYLCIPVSSSHASPGWRCSYLSNQVLSSLARGMSQRGFPFSPAGKSIRIHEPPFVIMSDLRDRGRDCKTIQGKVSSKFMSIQMSSVWALWTLRWRNINYHLSPEVEAGTKRKARGEWFFFKCVLLEREEDTVARASQTSRLSHWRCWSRWHGHLCREQWLSPSASQSTMGALFPQWTPAQIQRAGVDAIVSYADWLLPSEYSCFRYFITWVMQIWVTWRSSSWSVPCIHFHRQLPPWSQGPNPRCLATWLGH